MDLESDAGGLDSPLCKDDKFGGPDTVKQCRRGPVFMTEDGYRTGREKKNRFRKEKPVLFSHLSTYGI